MNKLTIIIIFLLAGGAIPAWCNPGVIEQTDALIEAGRYRDCIRILEEDLPRVTSSIEKVEIYWRLSQAWYFVAEQDRNKTGDKALVSRGNEKGAACASEAVKLNKNSAMALFWRAANWGSWAQQNENLSALEKISGAKDDLVRAIALKPDFTDAYYALGSLYAGAPGWPISFGNKEFGISLIRRAIDTIGGRKEVLRGYTSLAGALWERNWDSGARNSKQAQWRKVFDRKTVPSEKYCYYEGAMDFTVVRDYAGRPLASLSDREEALRLIDFAEKQIPLMELSAAEQDALRHSVDRARKKCR